MANKKISELPAIVSVGAADLLEVSSSGVSYKATATLLKEYVLSDIRIPDLSGNNYLTLDLNEELTANRTLNLVVNDGNRILTVVGDTVISGTNTGDQATPTSMTYTVVAKTEGVGAPYQIVAADSMKIFTNQGATAEVYLNLPVSPVEGQTYTGYCVDADNMRFAAQSGATIRQNGTVSAANGYCQLTGIGSSITLVYLSANNSWGAIAAVGTNNIV